MLHDTTLHDEGIGCASGLILILELSDAEERGVGTLEPSFGNQNTEVVRACATIGLLSHTEAGDIDKVGPHRVAFGTTIETQNIGVVRLIVVIKVNRGNRIGLGFTCFYGVEMMIIAHKHHGIIINGVTIRIHSRKKCRTRTCDSIAHRGVNHLVFSGNGIAIAVGVYLSATDPGYIISGFHCRIIHLVGIWVGQINASGPIWLDSDGRHAFGYIPVSTLVKDTVAATCTVKVLAGAIAVGEIVSTPGVGSGEGAGRAACDADYLPASHHAVAIIILRAHVVIVRQLHLVVVEVEAVGVLVGDVEGELGGSNCSSRWTLVHCSVAHLYVDGQCAKLAAIIAIFFSWLAIH